MQANLIKFITQDILFWSSKGKERTQMRLVLWAYDLCRHSGPYTQKCRKLFLIPAAFILRASLVAQRVKRLPATRETWVWSLGREDFTLRVLMIFEWRSLHFHCARGPESYATSWRQALFCKFLLLRSSFLSAAFFIVRTQLPKVAILLCDALLWWWIIGSEEDPWLQTSQSELFPGGKSDWTKGRH